MITSAPATTGDRPSDEAAALAALGDPNRWVDDHGEALMAFAVSRIGDREVAEDLVQETLLAGWRARGSFDGGCSPRTWFVAILKRKVADHFRQRGRSFPTPESSDSVEPAHAGPSPEHTATAMELWTHIGACTGRLPAHLARILKLRTFQDETPDTICRDEGISRKNLSVRLHRARRMLLDCLERSGMLERGGCDTAEAAQ